MVFLVRGLPGAGKSTYAKKLGVFHVEADMYFMRNSIYTWSRDEIGKAHDWCFNSFKTAVDLNMDVVVSNTFVTKKELKRYVDYCNENKVNYKVITMTNNYGSVHNVPLETLDKMADKWEPYIGEDFCE